MFLCVTLDHDNVCNCVDAGSWSNGQWCNYDGTGWIHNLYQGAWSDGHYTLSTALTLQGGPRGYGNCNWSLLLNKSYIRSVLPATIHATSLPWIMITFYNHNYTQAFTLYREILVQIMSSHDVATLMIPLLLCHQLNENVDEAWIVKRAELVMKCMKGNGILSHICKM